MCLTKDEDISKKMFLPVVLYGRQRLFQLDMHVQNFEYICPLEKEKIQNSTNPCFILFP